MDVDLSNPINAIIPSLEGQVLRVLAHTTEPFTARAPTTRTIVRPSSCSPLSSQAARRSPAGCWPLARGRSAR
jgi:hypothetical protein